MGARSCLFRRAWERVEVVVNVEERYFLYSLAATRGDDGAGQLRIAHGDVSATCGRITQVPIVPEMVRERGVVNPPGSFRVPTGGPLTGPCVDVARGQCLLAPCARLQRDQMVEHGAWEL